jgi:lipoprotein-anchoring transpeptidase ErfK/SrfK
MRVLLWSVLCCGFWLGGFKSAALASESLLDIASPEEVAAELNLQVSTQPDVMQPASIREQNERAGVDLTELFPVVVVVNKSEIGPKAQTMKVYSHGLLKYEFPVSTGREQWEDAKSGRRYFSVTSVGWFTPTETFEKYYSQTWKAWMNNSIFFNGGLALHATTPEHFARLGHRDSGGCVRLHPKNAKLLWDLVLGEGQGNVPAFTWDGHLQKNRWGRMVYHHSWNTLIIIEDNPTN